MTYQVTLTEVRADGMQKWERLELPKADHRRYIWLATFQSKNDVKIGQVEKVEFVRSPSYSLYKLIK